MESTLKTFKATLKSIPLVGPALIRVNERFRPMVAPKFSHSSQYWQERYALGGNSGAGSYNRLAEFKAEIINQFVATSGIESVVEFGTGDGNQLLLGEYPRFLGVDVSLVAVNSCRQRFRGDPTKSFMTLDEFRDAPHVSDLSLSLDVIYHLVEDDVFHDYMDRLFAAASRFVIVYASNEDRPTTDSHVRHRQFTNWVLHNKPEWALVKKIDNRFPFDAADPHNTSFADFYFFEKNTKTG